MKRYITSFDTDTLEQLSCDVLVVGAGLAGLYTALHLNPRQVCLIAAKADIDKSNSWLAQGGIAAVLNEEDAFESHINDTLVAGAGLCNRAAVEVLVREGPENIQQLLDWQIPFDRDEQGALAAGREGGHSFRRIVHSGGDATGLETTKHLSRYVAQRDNIRLLWRTTLLDILTDEQGVAGALVDDGQLKLVRTRHIVLASGGIGYLYRYTTNPDGAIGDGIAAAHRAGAETENMEMVQFHPTAMISPLNQGRLFLISEAVRGEGAVLRNLAGEAFMANAHPMKDLAPRDIVTREIVKNLEKTGDPYALLDVSGMTREFFFHRFPTISDFCARSGIRLTEEPIPIHPAQHYFMGGIKTDLDGRTGLPGLYAVGECACNGLHGANRLASNSMLECLVYSRRVARCINGQGITPPPTLSVRHSETGEAAESDERINEQMQSLRTLMSKEAGAIKTKAGLARASGEIDRMFSELHHRALPTKQARKLYNMLTVAKLLVDAARQRDKNVGAHYVVDQQQMY